MFELAAARVRAFHVLANEASAAVNVRRKGKQVRCILEITAVSDIPRGTLRSSRNRRLSEHFCDRVLFDYVSFIRLP